MLTEWNSVYAAHNKVACLMLGNMTPELHRQFKNYSPYEMLQELKSMFEKQFVVKRFNLIRTFHACKLEDGKTVGAYVLKMKDYVKQLERLGYVLPHDLSVGLILNGLTSDFASFVRNYNMYNMRKTIGELHALLIEYEKDLPKKAATPQVMAIQGGRIHKANKKSQKTKGRGKGKCKAKNDACHHCKEVGYWKRNYHVYLAELMKNKKQVGTTSFEPPHEEEAPIRSSIRTHQAPERLCQNVEVKGHSLGDLNEPANYKAAIWLFKKKADMVGNVHTYKDCLVANGFTQIYEVDYEEMLSPVTDIRVIRTLIAIAVNYEYEIWKMDVKTAFLNGYLDEDIYMLQPKGFVDHKHPKKSKRLIRLSQSTYMDKILKRYRMDNFKRDYIPMQERLDLNKTQGASTLGEVKHMQNVPYASAVGSIMYAVRCTRPDVALFLVYGENPEAEPRVDCYRDAGFETDRDDTKSQT
nr:hypothetical protein [Tanacetum cinerariifolium]